LPAGQRIDVSGQNLLPSAAGDAWTYNKVDASGAQVGTVVQSVVSGPDANGRITVVTDDGTGPETQAYIVSADGIVDLNPLGAGAPAGAANLVGAVPLYVTPLYPQGAVRRHMRSGPWSVDLDGDGQGESFRFEFTQVFLGFEAVQLSSSATLISVAHFRNVYRLTLRPTWPGSSDYWVEATEETWLAPQLGVVKVLGSATDSDGAVVDPPYSYLLFAATVSGTGWSSLPPPVALDGTVIDVALVHNKLVYDTVSNRYYASIPGSVVGTGNSIATIDPADGQISYSPPVGSEPNALAVSADGSTLYVGLDGSGHVAKLSLPSLMEQGRTSLQLEDGLARADAITVSPVDPNVVAVSMSYGGFHHAGVALLRNMVMQPVRTPRFDPSNLVAFDTSGTAVYGLNTENTDFGLRRLQVMSDGLSQQARVTAATNFDTQALTFSNGEVIAGAVTYAASQLEPQGVILSASDCWRSRFAAVLMCLAAANVSSGHASVTLADPATFVIRASLLFSTSEPLSYRRMLVEGPAGQVAVSYPTGTPGSVSGIRLFSSPTLLAPPAPPAPSWPVVSTTTADGEAMDVGVVHNALVYDHARNRYYASVPGTVLGAGNSIAIIDPSTGQVSHTAPIGSEPGALALAADASKLYVGLNGSGEVLELSLPSMTEAGRARLMNGSFGQARAETIAVSPAAADVVAVSLAWSGMSPSHAGVALLRNMVLQPARTQGHTGSNLVAFDDSGTTLYGLNTESTEFGLRRIAVQSDGVVEEQVVGATTTTFYTRALAYASGHVYAGWGAYAAPGLARVGVVAASDCWPVRASPQLLCLADMKTGFNDTRIVVADAATFVIQSSLLAAAADQGIAKHLVQGPSDQVAISYPRTFDPYLQSAVRIFSSPALP
jgi:hypothetical protein